MDRVQYTTLVDVLKQLPDPRKRQGRRHRWLTILTLIAAALASAQRTPQAIARWVHSHREQLFAQLPPSVSRLPSGATIRRALSLLDVAALEKALTAFHPPTVPARSRAAGGGVGPSQFPFWLRAQVGARRGWPPHTHSTNMMPVTAAQHERRRARLLHRSLVDHDTPTAETRYWHGIIGCPALIVVDELPTGLLPDLDTEGVAPAAARTVGDRCDWAYCPTARSFSSPPCCASKTRWSS